MLIKSERLCMRRVEEGDWRSIRDIWADFNRSEYAQYDKPHDTAEEVVCARIAKWAQYCKSMEHMFYAVCLEERIIGYVAFNIREDGHEIGYCFHSDFHGKGYAKESLATLIGYMRNIGVKRLTAGTALKNIPSVRLLNSLGFQLVGEEKVSFYKDADGNDIVFDGGIFELIL